MSFLHSAYFFNLAHVFCALNFEWWSGAQISLGISLDDQHKRAAARLQPLRLFLLVGMYFLIAAHFETSAS